MVEAWLIELLHASWKFFIHPMLYICILMIVIGGIFRIKRERNDFGVKVFDLFTEWRRTWSTTIISGIVMTIIMLGAGFIFSYETIILLNIFVVLFFLSGRFTMTSAVYTIGFTYLVLYIAPFVLKQYPILDVDLLGKTNFAGLSLLIGLFLIIEAIMIRRIQPDETYPELLYGKRGKWIAQHNLRKVGMIPFIILVPGGVITSFAPYWPVVSIGQESFALLLVPMFIGFNYKVRSTFPMDMKKAISNQILFVGIIVIGLAIGSIYIPLLSLAGVCFALIGKEWIHYRNLMKQRLANPYFTTSSEGLRILAILPDSPGERLGLLPGEIITKVNGRRIFTEDELYNALQQSGSFCKLEVMDHLKEVRHAQSAIYEGDHHRIGIITIREPYRTKQIVEEHVEVSQAN